MVIFRIRQVLNNFVPSTDKSPINPQKDSKFTPATEGYWNATRTKGRQGPGVVETKWARYSGMHFSIIIIVPIESGYLQIINCDTGVEGRSQWEYQRE